MELIKEKKWDKLNGILIFEYDFLKVFLRIKYTLFIIFIIVIIIK